MATTSSYIAQTFTVNTGDNLPSILLSKIDLFFSTKSSTYPVTLQLRPVTNGTPSSEVIPFSSVTLQPADVNTSTNSTKATEFVFDAPVILKNKKEYAIVVMAGANSDEYRLWTSEVTKNDVVNDTTISKQPATGVLMTSSNGRTFSVIQTEDLKYTLYRARFANETSTVVLENQNLDFFDINSITDRFRVGETIRGMSILTFANNDGVAVGTVLKSKHAANNNSVTHPSYANGTIRTLTDNGDGTVTVKVDALGNFPTASTSNTNNIYLGDGSWIGNTSSFTANTKTAVIDSVDHAKLTMTVTDSTGGWNANTTAYIRGQSSGASATVDNIKDVTLNVAVPKIPYISFTKTTESWSMRTATSSGVIGQEYLDITMNSDNKFTDNEKGVIGKNTSVTPVDGSDKTVLVKGDLRTSDARLSAPIDLSRSNIIAIGNIINNDSTDEHKEVGNAKCRYITKAVELEDGQDAEDLKLFLSAYKPSGTDVKVYAKVKSSTDEESFSLKDFTPLRQVTSSTKFSDSVDENDFLEFEYTFSANTNGQDFLGSSWANNHAYLNTSDDEILYYRSTDGSFHKSFKTFAIKIVLTSASTALVPTVKDMRAIAVQK